MRVWLLALVVVVSTVGVVATLPGPVAAQGAWCGYALIAYSPQQGQAGSVVTMSYTFYNFYGATLDVYDFNVAYTWTSGWSNLGSAVIPSWGTADFTQSVSLPGSGGTYDIDITVYGQASGDSAPYNCVFTAGHFSVSTGPWVSISASIPSGDAPLTVSFSAAGAGGTPPYSYAWTFGDGGAALGAFVSHTYKTGDRYTVQVTCTDNVGIQSTATLTEVVFPQPSIALSASRLAGPPGASVNFTATASGGSGGFTYNWTFGDGTSATGSRATHVYAAPGVYTATVEATDSDGGHGWANWTVTIAFLVADASESLAAVAPNESVAFVANPSGGAGGPYTVSWDFGDGSTGTGTSALHAYAHPGTYTPIVTVTDQSGATNRTALPAIAVGSPTGILGSGLFLYVGIAVAVIAAGIAVTILTLRRRRGKTPDAPKPQPPAPPGGGGTQ